MKKKISLREKRRFEEALKKIFKEPLQLIIHDNTHIFLNAKSRRRCWTFRLHWIFLKKISMARHIALYTLYRNKESSKKIDHYIEKHWHWVRHPLPPIITQGKVYNLKNIFDRLNRKYFLGKLSSHITWGPKKARRAYEQMQMGSYSTSRNLITLHPHLDQKFVPSYVVEATVFHEMCHARIPVQKINGRRQIHPRAFVKLEKKYSHLDKALRWEEKNLKFLLKKVR